MGSFTIYHYWLIHTNQTTIEQLSPFLLLRHMPGPSPPVSRGPNSHLDVGSPYYFPSPDEPRVNAPWVPQEHELNYRQRRMVQRAAEKIRMYDIGWRRNWSAIYGVEAHRTQARWKLILRRVLWGGGASCVSSCLSHAVRFHDACCSSAGDGYSYPANPRSDELLAQLAAKVYSEDDNAIAAAQRRDMD